MTKDKITVGEWFYYPYNGKWYRYIDTRDADGKLISRVCETQKESK